VTLRVLLAALALTALTPLVPASAATTYAAPLRTAVRQLPVAAENTSAYDRSRYFGGWTDTDRDCQSSRHEVLLAEGTGVRLSSSSCTVVGGTWRSFYDGKTYTSPSQLQIDHLIPVSEAWDSGAHTWTQSRRVAFYNDLGVGYALNAIVGTLNQSKSDKGPEAWMPPVNRCRYIEIWTAMKHRWGLRVDAAERNALIRYADGCPNNVVAVRRY
jgi:hypothetical protein